MIIESIDLEHVGPFRKSASIGPLRAGINVLAAPNETGKSTFVRAAARALFDKHTCKDDEIQSLRPAGSDLAPKATVVFEHGGTRYRIEKRFLSSPESRLSEWRNNAWQLLAEADAADERTQKLLQSIESKRGATKAAHWGMLGFLWARQGEPCDWPSWEGEAGQAMQSRLVRVQIDSKIECLRDHLWADYLEIFTGTGRAKKGGPLEQLETELEKIDADLAVIAEKRRELESTQRRHAELGPRLSALEAEDVTKEQEANALKALASQTELSTQELAQRQGELDTAKEKLDSVTADRDQLNRLQRNLESATSSLDEIAKTLEDASEKEGAAKKRVGEAQLELEAISARVKLLAANSDRAGSLVKLKRGEADQAVAEKLLKKASALDARARELRAELNTLPAITPAKLKKLHDLDDAIRHNQVKLDAIGLAVELRPEKDSIVNAARDGAAEKYMVKAGEALTARAGQNLELNLVGWGSLRIRSGAAELGLLADELTENRDSLRELLASVQSTTVADADLAHAKRKDLQKDLDAAEEKLADAIEGFESLEKLQAHCANLERQTKSLRELLVPSPQEVAMTVAELDSEAERYKAALKAETKAQTAGDAEMKKLRDIVEESVNFREQAGRQSLKLETECKGFEERIENLKGRYAPGLEPARLEAQSGFVRAEARRDEAKRKLPPDADKLPERNRRAAAARQQVRDELESNRREHHKLEGALQALGSEGLYSKESSLLEKRETAQAQIEALRAKGWAARIAHDLIEFRKQAATRSVLGPLEERLSSTFAEISRDSERRVFLDEHLQIAGVGANRDAVISFAHLSQGAKEQLLLCLRLAVAEEVSSTGHRLVVLDDVLVNTDGQRQERVLDLLQTFAGRLQILVLTCHPANYRGIGTVAEIRTS